MEEIALLVLYVAKKTLQKTKLALILEENVYQTRLLNIQINLMTKKPMIVAMTFKQEIPMNVIFPPTYLPPRHRQIPAFPPAVNVSHKIRIAIILGLNIPIALKDKNVADRSEENPQNVRNMERDWRAVFYFSRVHWSLAVVIAMIPAPIWMKPKLAPSAT